MGEHRAEAGSRDGTKSRQASDSETSSIRESSLGLCKYGADRLECG